MLTSHHTPAAPAQPSLPLGAGKRSLLPCFGDFSTMLDDKLNSSVKIEGVRGYLPSNADPLGRAVTPAGLPTATVLVGEAALEASSDKEEGDSFGLPEEGLRRRLGGRHAVGSLRSAQLRGGTEFERKSHRGGSSGHFSPPRPLPPPRGEMQRKGTLQT